MPDVGQVLRLVRNRTTSARGPIALRRRLSQCSASLDGRTLVRYRSSMANDRSYRAMLQDYYARHRALRSCASIGQLLGLRSKSSVAAMVARLKLAGFIDSTPDRRLAPTKRFFERPLAADPVHAGMPSRIDDAPADRKSVV